MKTNNELIAEFDGWVFFNDASGDFPDGYYMIKDGDRFTLPKTADEFQYDSSWDWLMPIIEKIENMGCIVEIWLSLGKGCCIQKIIKNGQNWQAAFESNSTIEAAYNSVVEFIKWHNSQSRGGGI